jgi:nucleoside-diphosphate-sugar epimerase
MVAIDSVEALEEALATPSARDQDSIRRIDGDIIVLGAGGKIGPSLSRRIKRAAEAAGTRRTVFAVSRLFPRKLTQELSRAGIEPIACDLLNRHEVARLPAVPNVLFLSGRKFGSADRPDLTWMSNTVMPAHVAYHYRSSRIVAFSTGNVYPLVRLDSGGSVETDEPGPVGEYAQSCLGRERVFEFHSRECATACLLFRLNYAVDLRYGVLVDIAQKVHGGQPVDLAVPAFNAIWQGDANSYALRSLELCSVPPRILNVTGPETVTVRQASEFFAACFGREPSFRGAEGGRALLSNASLCHTLLGYPEISMEQLMHWVADWVERGGASLNKPTKFEVADGRF